MEHCVFNKLIHTRHRYVRQSIMKPLSLEATVVFTDACAISLRVAVDHRHLSNPLVPLVFAVVIVAAHRNLRIVEHYY